MKLFVCAEVLPKCKLNVVLHVSPSPSLLANVLLQASDAFSKIRRLSMGQDAADGNVVFYGDEWVVFNPPNEWRPLLAAEQLHDSSQCYVFQKRSSAAAYGISDDVGALPPPVELDELLVDILDAPPRGNSAGSSTNTEAVPTAVTLQTSPNMSSSTPPASSLNGSQRVPLPEWNPDIVLDALFAQLAGSDDFFTLVHLQRVMEGFGMDTSEAAVGKTFHFGDRRIAKDVFCQFIRRHWNVALELLSFFEGSHVTRGPSVDQSDVAPLLSARQQSSLGFVQRPSASPPRRPAPSARTVAAPAAPSSKPPAVVDEGVTSLGILPHSHLNQRESKCVEETRGSTEALRAELRVLTLWESDLLSRLEALRERKAALLACIEERGEAS